MAKMQKTDQFLATLRDDPAFFAKMIWQDRGLDKYGTLLEPEMEMIRFALSYDSPQKRGVLAPRGIGKTYMVAAVGTCYDLFRDPEAKIVIVSKAEIHARKVLYMIRQWIDQVWFLQHLSPKNRASARDTRLLFDVGPSRESKDASVVAVSIEGQLPGMRASRIYVDDVETPENTRTSNARDDLSEQVIEFPNIASYGRREIVYTGTYHHDESLYIKLANERNYHFKTWPIAIPTEDEASRMLDLADSVRRRMELSPAGDPVFPNRLGHVEIAERKSEGLTNFARQHMLIARLGEGLQYPLKLKDLIVPDFQIDPYMVPRWIKWGMRRGDGTPTKWDEQILPCYGNAGDSLHFHIQHDDKNPLPITEMRMHVDPSGSGADETAWGIGGGANGYMWVCEVDGVGAGTSGSSPEVMKLLAVRARRWGVRYVTVETQFGGETFAQLLQHELEKLRIQPGIDPNHPEGWACMVETKNASSRMSKEERICATLEPVMNNHRLVINPESLKPKHDQPRKYMLQHQIAGMQRRPKCLEHDDRVDVLAGLVADLAQALDTDPEIQAQRDEERLRDERLAEIARRHNMEVAGDSWVTHPGRFSAANN